MPGSSTDSREAALAAEAGRVGLVGGELGDQDLERPDPVEREVAGAVDDAHAAAPDLGLDLVAGEMLTGPERRLSAPRPIHQRRGYAARAYFVGCGTIRM